MTGPPTSPDDLIVTSGMAQPTHSELYERYLTAFSCTATGSACQPCSGCSGAFELHEAAQCCGVIDGLLHRNGEKDRPSPMLKSLLLTRVYGMLGMVAPGRVDIDTPAGVVRLTLEVPSTAALVCLTEKDWTTAIEKLLGSAHQAGWFPRTWR